MSTPGEPSEDAASGRPHRVRLVPPRLGEVLRYAATDRKAERWARGLRVGSRQRLVLVAGNILLFGVLVGVPMVRGHYRAVAARIAYHEFIGCVYGVRSAGGLGDLRGEAEYLAARLADSDRGWLAHCQQLLSPLAPSAALFVLPGAKESEARVRDAVAMTRAELAALSAHRPGARMPARSLRALRLLRETVRAQLEQAGLTDGEAALPVVLSDAPKLPAPAMLPIYAAADAALEVWGDDQTLRIVALDSTGLSFLELDVGKPFTRARLVRPRTLRGFARVDGSGWLAWATPPARCAERADGCFGKATQLAPAPAPLLRLPEPSSLAIHLAGRLDRSIAPHGEGLLVAGVTSDRRVSLREFILTDGLAVGPDVPPLAPSRSWSTVLDEALVLTSAEDSLVVGLKREGRSASLVRVGREGAEVLAALDGGKATWLTGCKHGRAATLAFGDGARARLGFLEQGADGWRARFWPELSFVARSVIDPERAARDRVAALCLPSAALVVAVGDDERLSALLCRHDEERCKSLPVADGVSHFTALVTAEGALVAYAGDAAPQVRVRAIDANDAKVGAEQLPAACWTSHGLCSRPTLARLGNRILLLAPDGTDLLALESADQGRSFRPVPVL